MQVCTLEIREAILTRFPDLQVRGVAASGLTNVKAADPDAWFAEAERRLNESGVTVDALTATPCIGRWREAMREQGLKPAEIRSSAEALARRALRGNRPVTGIPLVDVCNAASIAFLAPIGAYDAARLPHSSVIVRTADPDTDHFEPIGGQSRKMVVRENVAVYASDSTILCWAFNHKDAAATAVDQATDTAVVFAESLDSAQHDAAQRALSTIAAWLTKRGAVVGSIVESNREHRSVTLDAPEADGPS
jgi:DNA/RNA-binding domain of Phe-tRNA-synthetase-like protein